MQSFQMPDSQKKVPESKMKEYQLKNRLGIFIFIGHFALVILVIIIHFIGWFDFPKMLASLEIIIPLFAAYTTIILKFFISTKNKNIKASKKIISPQFVFISFFLPSILMLFIATTVILKGIGLVFDSFEQFRTTLALSESVFGVYLGQVIFSLFEK